MGVRGWGAFPEACVVESWSSLVCIEH